MEAIGTEIDYVEVDDQGAALMDAGTKEEYQRLVKLHNDRLIQPTVKLGISIARECFTEETAKLLELIEEYRTVKDACKYAGVSYSNSWELINMKEAGLGYSIVGRLPGGKNGGEAYLTDKGKELLAAYCELQKELEEIVNKKYSQIFLKSES